MPSSEPRDDQDDADRPFSPPTGGEEGRHAHRKKRKGSFFRELVILVLTAFVLTIVIQTFLARVYVIPSGSMEQTLHGCDDCRNDRILVDKVSTRFVDPTPGDVIVFRGPDAWTHNDFHTQRSDNPVVAALQGVGSMFGLAPPDERDFVKRVIAVPGQTVQCCDQNRVVVDGKPLNEPYIYWYPGRGDQQKSFAPVKVPPGRLWVMGDSRNNSEDSRYQGGGGVNGTIGIDDVIGKARLIVLPPDRWGVVHAQDPQPVAMGAPAWQVGLPATGGLAAAFPVVWLGRRIRAKLYLTKGRG